MEDIITQNTQGNYAKALELFAEIGRLSRNHTMVLSDKERNIFFDCYHYRRIQMRKDMLYHNPIYRAVIVRELQYREKALFYKLSLTILNDLIFEANKNPGAIPPAKAFLQKLVADKAYFETYYKNGYNDITGIWKCCEMYGEAFKSVKTFLGDAEPTVLDACLGYSTTTLEDSLLANDSSTAIKYSSGCDVARTCQAKGLTASSESNPDLIPLTQFIQRYCKPDAPSILEDKSFLVKELPSFFTVVLCNAEGM